MSKQPVKRTPHLTFTRRQFLKLGGSAVAAITSTALPVTTPTVPCPPSSKPRNILLIFTDQQHISTIAAAGCPYVRTPAMDWLVRNGVTFSQSYTANPLCSPARSAILTGRTSSEAAVHINNRPIRSNLPNLGQWFSQHTDYETFYAGKWHLPRSFTADIPGFKVINTGIGGFGYMCDTTTSRACEAFLRNRNRNKPFLLVISFLQPHDICEWLRLNTYNPEQLRYPQIAEQLPPLPDNFHFDPNEPRPVSKSRLARDPFIGNWTEQQWRYYLWSYYRHIEQVDAELQRILTALQQLGYADNTLIVLTADHGEGLGHHQMVRKNTLYDESAKVPLIFAWPGHIAQGKTCSTHLASGLDIMPTLCDFAGIKPPPHMRGTSLRPLLENRAAPAREYIVSEVASNTGRMVRTPRYKYITFTTDPVEQLFDMQQDPGETRNLATESRYASVLQEHRRLLLQWERRLDVPTDIPHAQYWRHRQT